MSTIRREDIEKEFLDEDERFRITGRRQGKKLDAKQSMTVFCAWLHFERNALATSEATGVSRNTVIKLIEEGNPKVGVPSFNELVGMVEMNSLLASVAQIARYRFSLKKAVKQMLQICDGMRAQLKKAIVDDKMPIKNYKVALEVAKALPVIEIAYVNMARKFNVALDDVADHAAPKPEPKVEPKKEPQAAGPNFQEMSKEQIQEWVDQAQSEGEEPREQVG